MAYLLAFGFFVGVVQLVAGQLCPSGYQEYAGHCYRVSSNANEQYATWEDAQDFCIADGANLASVHSLEEHDFIISLAEAQQVTVGLWLGLSRRADPAGPFQWSTGEEVEYTYWGTGEPKPDGVSNCGMTETSNQGRDFDEYDGYTTTYYIPGFSRPVDADGVNTFNLGGGYDYDRNWCRDRCSATAGCEAYSWADYHWDYEWQYHCTGRSNYYANLDYDYSFYAGVRRAPDLENGWWFAFNCGIHMGFACKKPLDSDQPVTPAPTVPLESYCPANYFSVGNKCYKIVEAFNTSVGWTWNQSLSLCRNEPYSGADLASIHSQDDNAAISARLIGNSYGVWIGGLYNTWYKEFTWSDNSEWNYQLFMENEPSNPSVELCIQMMQTQYYNGAWNDLVCTERRGYVCQVYKDGDNPINTPPSTTPHDCEEGWTPYNQACYQLDPEARSWSDANDNCQALGGHLVSIHGSAQNSAVYLSAGKLIPAWIGLLLSETSGQFEWSDDWPVNWANWDDNGINNGTGCVEIKANEKWQNSRCDDLKASVCWKPLVAAPTDPTDGPGGCPSGDWMSYGAYCYYFDRDSYVYDWNEALLKCQELAPFSNVQIASIGSHMENDFILNEMRLRGIANGWLGLKRVAGGGFEWSDGSPLEYFNWAPDEPNNGDGVSPENCTGMYVDTWPGLWNDVPCTFYNVAPICKLAKGEFTTPVTPTPAPGDCPSPEWQKYGSDCLLFRPLDFQNWQSARQFCQSTDATADLVVMGDSGKNYFVHQTVIAMARDSGQNPNIWLGLYKTGIGQPYIWVDSTPLDYTNWAPGEPNDGTGTENCGRLYYSAGTWDDTDCYDDFYQGFVCEAPVVPPEQRKLKDKSSDVKIQDEAFEEEGVIDYQNPEALVNLIHKDLKLGHFNPMLPNSYKEPAQKQETPGKGAMSLASIAVVCVVLAVLISAAIGTAVFVYKKRVPPAPSRPRTTSVTFDNPLSAEEGFERSTYQY